MTRFKETVAVVTGAGSGIGKAVAQQLANEGAQVVLVGRTRAKLERCSEDINGSGGVATIFTADVTVEQEINALKDFVLSTFGDLHVLVNNAGGSRKSNLLNTTTEDWDYVQKTNLTSVFLTSRILGELMIKKQEAETEPKNRSIVNVASLSGHKAGAQIPHYSAAKAGVMNLTKSFAVELAPYGIRVNSVSPGFIETPLTEEGLKNERFEAAIKRNTALRRVGRPEEIANVITFLASHQASYMTGSDVLADGGWLIV